MPEPKLRVQGLCKSYGSVQILREIDLDVAAGEMVCLIGASGSGKSTLLRCMNLLEPLDDGEIWFNGQQISDVQTDPRPIRERIGIVFQTYNLFPHMTALDNVTLAPRRLRRQAKAQITERSAKLFAQFGLTDQMKKYPDQLSGGQQQRVAIVRALAMDPEILLFDEITSALDPELVGEVLAALRSLRAEGRTMILATHEMEFARELADRIVFLDGGQIMEQGTPEEIFEHPKKPRTREFLGSRG